MVQGILDPSISLEERLSTLKETILTCREPSIGLLDSGKELIREACRRVGLRSLEIGNTAALERLKDLEIWKSIELKPHGGTFLPITGANEIDVILTLLALKQMKKRSTGYKQQGPTQSMNPEADSIESTKTLIGELLREGKSQRGDLGCSITQSGASPNRPHGSILVG
jgi:hypothetical protein